jgi:hypothetical protein
MLKFIAKGAFALMLVFTYTPPLLAEVAGAPDAGLFRGLEVGRPVKY